MRQNVLIVRRILNFILVQSTLRVLVCPYVKIPSYAHSNCVSGLGLNDNDVHDDYSENALIIYIECNVVLVS